MSVLVPSVKELDIYLKGLVKWDRFAHQLPHIKAADIQIIKTDKKDDVESQRLALYEKWLQLHPNASWNDVVTALVKVDENTIAENLRRTFHLTESIKVTPEAPLSSPLIDMPATISTQSSEYKVPASIVKELEGLHKTFVPLATEVNSQIEEAVNNGQVSIKSLARYVHQHSVVGSRAPPITSATNVEDILQHQYTFLSPNIIFDLASFFHLHHPIAKAEDYKSRIEAFKKNVKVRSLKNEISRFNERFRKSPNLSLKILVTNAWGELSIRVVETLLLTLFPIVHPDDLPWYSVCAGSLLLSFIASNHMILPLIVSCARKMEFMRHMGIISVTIGNILIRVNDEEAVYDRFFSFENSLIEATTGDDIEGVRFLLKYIKVNVNATHSNRMFLQKFYREYLQHETEEKTLESLKLHFSQLKDIRDDIFLFATSGSDDEPNINEFLKEIEYHVLNIARLRKELSHLGNPVRQKLTDLYDLIDRMKASAKIGYLHKFLQSFPRLNYTTQVTISLNKVWSDCSAKSIEIITSIIFPNTPIEEFYWFRVKELKQILKVILLISPKPTHKELKFDHFSAKAFGLIEVQLNNDTIFENNGNKYGYSFEKGIHEAKGKGRDKTIDFLKHVILFPCTLIYKTNLQPDDKNNNLQSVPDRDSTPLMIACCNSNSQLVELLLEHNADPNVKTSSSNTALFFSINSSKIFQMLIDHGANIHDEPKQGETLLQYACLANNVKIVDILLNNKYLNINTQGHLGYTALWRACSRGYIDVVNRLLQAKADPSIPNDMGATPLWAASSKGWLPVVERLLEAKMDPNIPNAEGKTPLWIASENGYYSVVERLLLAQVDPRIPDNNGVTPLQIAGIRGHARTLSMLFNHILASCDNNEEKVAWIADVTKLLSKEVVHFLLWARADPSILETRTRSI